MVPAAEAGELGLPARAWLVVERNGDGPQIGGGHAARYFHYASEPSEAEKTLSSSRPYAHLHGDVRLLFSGGRIWLASSVMLSSTSLLGTPTPPAVLRPQPRPSRR
jgi:hypothetical protein